MSIVRGEQGRHEVLEGVESRREGKKIPVSTLIVCVVVVTVFAAVIQRPQFLVDTNRAEVLSTYLPSIPGVVFLLLFLLINAVGRALFKKEVFSQSDLVLIYIAAMVGATFAGNGFFRFQFGLFGTMANSVVMGDNLDWFQNVSTLLIPRDETMAFDFALGDGKVIWKTWFAPIILWTLFALLSMFVMICTATIFRRRWTDHERLRYPLTLPVTNLITAKSDNGVVPFWRNSLTYLGMLIPVIFIGSQVMNRYIPAIPRITAEIRLVNYAHSDLMKFVAAMHPAAEWKLTFEPLLVGVGYLMPTTITLSSVFFFYLDLVGRGVFYSMGLPQRGDFMPRVGFWGVSTLLYGVIALWIQRKELKAVFVSAFSGVKMDDDASEPMSYRMAVFGALLGLILLIVFLRVFFGVTVWVGCVYMLVTIFSIIGFAKVRAASGIPVDSGLEWTDVNMLGTGLGTKTIGESSAVGLAHMMCFHVGGLGSGMIIAMESYAMGDEVGLNRKSIAKLLLLVVVVALVVSFLVAIPMVYKEGWLVATFLAQHMSSAPIYDHIIRPLESGNYLPTPFAPGWLMRNLWHLVTVVVLPLLMYLNMNYVWWPLHPVGYILATDVTIMARFWTSFFVAGMAKLLIMRYGGYQLHQKITPLFLGIVVGSAVVSGIDVILAFILGA